MASQRINVTLGTAGHIDHGKTALVKCLTGCETDRLKAEKERGMSIDLGFAPCTISDLEVGIVDVPGHENFVKTMVAGASGIDGVILVVAADDGVMPQTREHLDILTLLGVRHGLVVLTKIDRVEPDHLELAREEMDEFLRGTFLDGAPVLPLSNVTGEGFGPFYEALESLVRGIQPRPIDGVFRLPVDRAFSAKGYGTVLAGIPVTGSAHTGDELLLLPHEVSGRIKTIEVYGRQGDTVMAGQCAALNVPQWERRRIDRGHTAAAPGYFSVQQWYACTLRLLPPERLPKARDKAVLKSGARVKFHTGTTEVMAAVYPMEGNLVQPGDQCLVQIRTEIPLVAAPADHFILRALSPVQTIGGGMIVEAVPKRLKRNRPHVHQDLKQRAEAVRMASRDGGQQFVEYCVRQADGLAARENELAARAKVPRARLKEILQELTGRKTLVQLPSGLYVHRDTAAEAGGRVLQIVRDYHRSSPESPGLTLEQLRQAAQLDRTVLDGLIGLLKSDGRLVLRNQRLAAAEHQATFKQEDTRHLEAIESLFRETGFHPPGVEEIVDKTSAAAKVVESLLKILVEHERLVQVAEGVLFHRQAVEQARELLVAHIQKEGRLESVQFKYLLDTTRKFAIPMLDYFDRVGVTRRSGNTRYLKSTPGGKTP